MWNSLSVCVSFLLSWNVSFNKIQSKIYSFGRYHLWTWNWFQIFFHRNINWKLKSDKWQRFSNDKPTKTNERTNMRLLCTPFHDEIFSCIFNLSFANSLWNIWMIVWQCVFQWIVFQSEDDAKTNGIFIVDGHQKFTSFESVLNFRDGISTKHALMKINNKSFPLFASASLSNASHNILWVQSHSNVDLNDRKELFLPIECTGISFKEMYCSQASEREEKRLPHVSSQLSVSVWFGVWKIIGYKKCIYGFRSTQLIYN